MKLSDVKKDVKNLQKEIKKSLVTEENIKSFYKKVVADPDCLKENISLFTNLISDYNSKNTLKNDKIDQLNVELKKAGFIEVDCKKNNLDFKIKED